MTIYTLKLTKKKIVAFILIVAVLIAAIIIAVPSRSAGTKQTAAANGINGSDDCVAYAKSLGYTVETEPADSRKVTIPKEFDDVYQKYNGIQRACGFDLQEYSGKTVMLYTFYVTNYDGFDDVLLDLLVYKNKIIGGAVYTADIAGFMHGLEENPTL